MTSTQPHSSRRYCVASSQSTACVTVTCFWAPWAPCVAKRPWPTSSSSVAAKADTARTSVPTLPPGVGCGATRNTSCFGRAAAAAEEKEEEEEEEEEEEGATSLASFPPSLEQPLETILSHTKIPSIRYAEIQISNTLYNL